MLSLAQKSLNDHHTEMQRIIMIIPRGNSTCKKKKYMTSHRSKAREREIETIQGERER